MGGDATARASLGSGNVTVSGNIALATTLTSSATATAEGIAVAAGIAAGASISTADHNPLVQTSIGGGTITSTGGIISLKSRLNANEDGSMGSSSGASATSGAVAAAQGIRANLAGDLQVRALQSYFDGKP